MAMNLSEGSIRAIMAGETIDPPILQVLGVRKLVHPGATDRYRIMLSDGVNSINFAMLATQHNEKIESGEIQDNAIIKLVHHITSKLTKEKSGERRVLIILNLELLVPGSEIGKIGDPVLFTEDMVGAPAPAAANGHAMMNGNSRPAPSLEQRPAKMARTDNYNARAQSSDVVTRPISSINPYQNKWVIRARVLVKSPVRTWNNARGSGKLFSMDLKDESGEIRATAFTDECDKFYDNIEQNHVYYISNCTVKTANKKFTSIANDFELTFTKETQVTPVTDDVVSIPGVEYNFTPIENLAGIEIGSSVDVIGVCSFASDVHTVMSRAKGTELKKRDLTLVDSTNTSISLTIWGDRAEAFDGTDHPIVAIRSAKLSEFQSAKSLGTPMNCIVEINPDIPEAHRLRGWYDNGGDQAVITSISSSGGPSGGGDVKDWMSMLDAKELCMGLGDDQAAPHYFSTVAHVMSVKRENCYYLACPTPECKKKVLDNNNGTYRCEKCQKDYDDFNPRMLVSLSVADWSESAWVTMFDTEAQTLLGVDGRTLYNLKQGDETGYNAVFDRVKFEPIQIRVRVKSERYNDESRLKYVVMRMDKVDIKQYNKRMLSEIKKLKESEVKPEPAF